MDDVRLVNTRTCNSVHHESWLRKASGSPVSICRYFYRPTAAVTFMTSYILIIPTCIMTFCYARITCVIWLRAGARYSTPDDVDLPRIHFVTSRRPPDASTPRGCSYGRRPTRDHQPRCQSSPRLFWSPTCAVGLPTKLAFPGHFEHSFGRTNQPTSGRRRRTTNLGDNEDVRGRQVCK